jgi:uncharacterized protein YndB with AHSA1/START domain
MSTDRIEKKIVLRASRARVWRAISSFEEFGAWFGMILKGPLMPGKTVEGKITTPGYDHLTVTMHVERVEPEHLLAYRWHPNATDLQKDYSSEPTTLVEFSLRELPGGTELTIVESGFDSIPLERRAKAFESNSGGWTELLPRIEQHVAS